MVKAFTLLELIIVLLLCSLIVGVAASTYLYVNKNFIEFKLNNEKLANVQKLQALLENDFFKSLTMKKVKDILLIITKTDSIKYYFNNNLILRNQNEIYDTILFSKSNVKYYINSFEEESDGIIDEIFLQICLNDIPLTFHCRKESDSMALVNLK